MLRRTPFPICQTRSSRFSPSVRHAWLLFGIALGSLIAGRGQAQDVTLSAALPHAVGDVTAVEVRLAAGGIPTAFDIELTIDDQ